jgi:hypothetical protein
MFIQNSYSSKIKPCIFSSHYNLNCKACNSRTDFTAQYNRFTCSIRRSFFYSLSLGNTLEMCKLIKRKYACGCEKPIFRNTICRHGSSVDARLCKLMTIEDKLFDEKCMSCKVKDTVKGFMGVKNSSQEGKAEGEAWN